MSLKKIFDKYFAAFLFGGLIIAAVVIGLLLSNVAAFIDCYKYHWATDRDYKVSFGTCYIKTETGWFEKSQLRSQE